MTTTISVMMFNEALYNIFWQLVYSFPFLANNSNLKFNLKPCGIKLLFLYKFSNSVFNESFINFSSVLQSDISECFIV